MKYIIARKFSFKNEKFRIIRDSKKLCTAKVVPSKEYNNRYNVKLSSRINKLTGEDSCIVEPDPEHSQGYLIYLKNPESKKKILSGQLFYQLCWYNNYLYTIIVGRKLYKVRSCDLKDRPLIIMDSIKSNHSSANYCPKTLFQVIDSFSKLTKKYHLTINDKKWQYVYLAIAILLDQHERK